VPANELNDFVRELFRHAGMSEKDAGVMADLLVLTDLRGVHSHGAQAAAGYIEMMRDGRVNPRPNVRVVSSTTTTRTYDGDGGMGHLPSLQAAEWVAHTAAAHGVAAATTTNHFHFGGAGKYSRLALAHGCIGFATSSHRFYPKGHIGGAGGGSPFSFAVPAGERPPLVIDMAASF
ncbi:uncharacterized protein METZ01_LOCUS349957, partial [marine metagenome]